MKSPADEIRDLQTKQTSRRKEGRKEGKKEERMDERKEVVRK